MGFALSIMNSRDSIEQERHAVDVLRARRIDGLLAVVALQRSDHEHFLTLQAAGTPIVCLDRIPEGIEVDCVSIDGCASARVGVEHLLALGHTRIAYIGGERSMYVAPERAEGYVQAMNGAALTPMVYEGDFRRESGFTLTREILAQPAPVTAIFCGNVQIALGVLQALRCLNLRVPDDISVATFDYFDWLDAFQPTLTSVIQPAYQIGFQGAQMLIRRLNGEAMTPFELRVLPTELRIGESTAAPRARARKSGA